MGIATLRRNYEAQDAARAKRRGPRPDVSAYEHDQAMAELHQSYGRKILELEKADGGGGGDAALAATLDQARAENEAMAKQVVDLQLEVAQLKEAAERAEARSDTIPPAPPKTDKSSGGKGGRKPRK